MANPNDPYYLQVRTQQLFIQGDGWEMYPALVYQGDFSLMAMYGDGDPDITDPGTCKVDCDVTQVVADAMKADPNITHIFIDQPGGRGQ